MGRETASRGFGLCVHRGDLSLCPAAPRPVSGFRMGAQGLPVSAFRPLYHPIRKLITSAASPTDHTQKISSARRPSCLYKSDSRAHVSSWELRSRRTKGTAQQRGEQSRGAGLLTNGQCRRVAPKLRDLEELSNKSGSNKPKTPERAEGCDRTQSLPEGLQCPATLQSDLALWDW